MTWALGQKKVSKWFTRLASTVAAKESDFPLLPPLLLLIMIVLLIFL